MKVNSVNYSTSILKRNTEHNNNAGKHAPAFKGNAFVALASFIENNGFMGEFLTIDTTGMGIPRAAQGYMRNREELGHLNYKAGREEVTRELLSGPSFFFVPLITTSLFALAKGKAALVPRKSLALMKELMAKTTANLKDGAEIKKNFVKTVINDGFGDYQHDRELVDKLSELLEKQATKKFSVVDKFKNLFRKEGEKLDTQARVKNEAEAVLTKLNKANEKFLNSTECMNLNGKTVSIKNFMSEMTNYLDDFTKKASTTTKDKDAFVDSFHKESTAMRFIAEISSIGALSAFIAYVPKLYQTGKLFPGKDGLVNNEQQAEKTADATPKKEVKEAA